MDFKHNFENHEIYFIFDPPTPSVKISRIFLRLPEKSFGLFGLDTLFLRILFIRFGWQNKT